MKVLFYCLYGAFGLLGVYFVFSSMIGRFAIDPLPQGISKLVLLLSAAVGSYLFYRGYLLGEVEQRWGAGTGMIVLGVVVFEGLPVVSMLAGGIAKKLLG